MKPQAICHLIVKDKVAVRTYFRKNTVTAVVLELQKRFTQQFEFQSLSYCSAIQCATGLKFYYVMAYQNTR